MAILIVGAMASLIAISKILRSSFIDTGCKYYYLFTLTDRFGF